MKVKILKGKMWGMRKLVKNREFPAIQPENSEQKAKYFVYERVIGNRLMR
jgi:hypothetical protein